MRLLNTKLTLIVLVSLAVAQSSKPAPAATVVFNNLSATTPYYQNAGNWLGTLANQYEITATTFTPSSAGQLDELTLGLIYQSGANSVTLRLSPDSGGLPSAAIWQASVPPAPGYGSLLNLTGIGGPTLNAGQLYWLEGIAPVTPATLHGWYTNNQGDKGPVIASGNYYANIDRFSLRVGVVTVPEPTACFLTSVGVIGMAMIRRRRG